MVPFMVAFALTAAMNGSRPLLRNPNFEQSPFLSGWRAVAHPERGGGRPATFQADRKNFKTGPQSLLIQALDPNEAEVTQKIFLPVGSLWSVKVWVKTDEQGPGSGAAFEGFIQIGTPIGDIGSSPGCMGTTSWHQEETVFRVPSPGFIELKLVGMQNSAGKVWFDDVRLQPLPSPAESGVRIYAQRISKRPISPMQQGQFIEFVCNLIPSIVAQQVSNTSFEDVPPCKFSYKKEIDEPHRPWYPDGAVEVARYSYDTADALNGARSLKIQLPVARARAGISQDGFYLKQGISYRLHLHLRGQGNVRVWASLHGGGGVIAGPVLLGRAGRKWRAAGAELVAQRNASDATLTIEFEGPGALWLDRVYLIGSDAVLGIWRPDVVAALKAIHPGIIRLGGSAIQAYEWKNGIGPWDRREPFTTIWGGMEENFIGLDEFIRLCRYIGAEPLLCVRWSGDTPQNAADEVEYCNGSAATRWGKLRARNGHPQPYHVKYWQIGNEVSGPDYDASVGSFAAAMKRADPKIKLLSSFPTPGLLKKDGGIFDYLCPHHYEIGDLLGENRDLKRLQDWIGENRDGKNVRVAVTEWNTTGGDFGLGRGMLQTLGNALSVSRYLNLLQRYADLVEIANRSNLADSFGSGFIVTGPGWIYESPAYYAQLIYGRAAGDYPLRVKQASQLPWQLREPDISAGISANAGVLRIYAVNSTLGPIATRFQLDGFSSPVRDGTAFVLEDHEHALTSEVMNSRDNPQRISLQTFPAHVSGSAFEFRFEPLTVTLLELRLAR